MGRKNSSVVKRGTKKVYGIPFLGDSNIEKQHIIKELQQKPNPETVEITCIDLVSNLKQKNSLVIIDNTYLTWLDDIEFDYVHKECRLPYLVYSEFKTTKQRNIQYYKSHNHLDYTVDNNGKQFIKVRYNYEQKFIDVKPGISLLIYELDKEKIIRYDIVSWVDTSSKEGINTFQINEIYRRYREYCYRDMESEFSEHESGYTYISLSIKQFSNTEKDLRRAYNLGTWKVEPVEKTYRDVRVYNYLDYISRISSGKQSQVQSQGYEYKLQSKLFKYRRLEFESYLFSHLMQHQVPEDIQLYPLWNKLYSEHNGLGYIKISDGVIPFFIKAEWLSARTPNKNKTWRRI